MSREEAVINILSNVLFLPIDLSRIIVRYDTQYMWDTKSSDWTIDGNPANIINYKKELYVCNYAKHVLEIYNLNGEIIKKNTTLNGPYAMDMDKKQGILYVSGFDTFVTLNLNLDTLSSWKLPTLASSYAYRGLKVDRNIAYLTFVVGVHQIYLCLKDDGKNIMTWGNKDPSGAPGEFNCPSGLTVVQEYVYVCDQSNNRIQILNKSDGTLVNQWKSQFPTSTKNQSNTAPSNSELVCPRNIYYYDTDDMFYVGDEYNVHLYTPNGRCVQQFLRGFSAVYGICIIDDNLYISSRDTKRISIFRRDPTKCFQND